MRFEHYTTSCLEIHIIQYFIFIYSVVKLVLQ
jgi:hypothetical protein